MTAIIESNNHSNITSRECVTPPAAHFHPETETEDTITKIDEEQIEVQDPPNTAPLPTKFGGNNTVQPTPHNLLRLQFHKKSLMDCDTSSAASEVMSPKTNIKLNASGPHQLKMSLPLKQRLRVVDISRYGFTKNVKNYHFLVTSILIKKPQNFFHEKKLYCLQY